jgi:hypothetical protein
VVQRRCAECKKEDEDEKILAKRESPAGTETELDTAGAAQVARFGPGGRGGVRSGLMNLAGSGP